MNPLDLTRQSIEAHWGHLQSAFRGLPIPEANRTVINTLWTTDLAVATWSGPAAESIHRERGGRVDAHPLFLNGNFAYWINWRENWNYVGGSKPWRFRESGITIFEGAVGDPNKVQLFRAEWPGITSWQRGTVTWQSPGAGHPHWQFDAMAVLDERRRRENMANEIVETLSSEIEPEEFNPEMLAATVGPPTAYLWTRMHFASLARWNEIGWDGDINNAGVHAHAPKDEKQIRRWITSAILYIRSELLH